MESLHFVSGPAKAQKTPGSCAPASSHCEVGSLRPTDRNPARLLLSGDSQADPGVGSHALLQGLFRPVRTEPESLTSPARHAASSTLAPASSNVRSHMLPACPVARAAWLQHAPSCVSTFQSWLLEATCAEDVQIQ